MFHFFANGDFFLLVHGAEPPDDAAWDRYLAALARVDRPNRFARILVLTEGGSPSSEQRERLGKASTKGDRSAVVCSAAVPRFVVSMLALINKDVRAFAPGDYARAVAFLDLGADEQKRVLDQIDQLKREGAIDTLRVIEEALASVPA
jgi:hypothetical protein